MCASSLFTNLRGVTPVPDNTDFRFEPDAPQEQSDYARIRELIKVNHRRNNLRRNRYAASCAGYASTYVDEINIDCYSDVLAAHTHLRKQFRYWQDSIVLGAAAIVLAGNGSKYVICAAFADSLITDTEYDILEVSPSSPDWTDTRGVATLQNLGGLSSDSRVKKVVIIYSADHPASQHLLTKHLFPLLDDPEHNICLILAVDTLFYEAQLQLWNIHRKIAVYDNVHTFLDFRIEMLLTDLRNRANHRFLLGESKGLASVTKTQDLLAPLLGVPYKRITARADTSESSASSDLEETNDLDFSSTLSDDTDDASGSDETFTQKHDCLSSRTRSAHGYASKNSESYEPVSPRALDRPRTRRALQRSNTSLAR